MLFDEMMDTRRMTEANGGKYEMTLEEQIERFEENIGMRYDPSEAAMAAHKAYLESKGLKWDDTPVSQIPELAAKMEDGGFGEFMGGTRAG